MRGTMLIFGQDGTLEVHALDWTSVAEHERLKVLTDAIGGGYLEVVPYFKSIEHEGKLHPCVAFCDEDGKRKSWLDYNAAANEHWRRAMRRAAGCSPDPDFLVGPIAVVFGDDEFMGAL